MSDATSATGTTPSYILKDNPHVSVKDLSSSIASDSGNDTPYDVSELGTPRHGKDGFSELGMDNSIAERDLIDSTRKTAEHVEPNKEFIYQDTSKFSQHNMRTDVSATDKVTENNANVEILRLDGTEYTPKLQDYKLDDHVRRLSIDSTGSDLSSIKNSELSNISTDLLVTFPSDARHKLNRILVTLQQRLNTAKTDVEDLLARLNQEMAARQFLMIKVSKNVEGFSFIFVFK